MNKKGNISITAFPIIIGGVITLAMFWSMVLGMGTGCTPDSFGFTLFAQDSLLCMFNSFMLSLSRIPWMIVLFLPLGIGAIIAWKLK